MKKRLLAAAIAAAVTLSLCAPAFAGEASEIAQLKAEVDKLNAKIVQLEAKQNATAAKAAAAENAQPKFKMMGQARLTYAARNDGDDMAAAYAGNKNKNNYFTYRMRLEGLATFGDKLTYFGRLRAQDYSVETGTVNSGSGSFSQVKVEQFWINWKKPFALDNTQVTAGRQGLFLGKGGVAMAVGDTDMIMFDYANKGFFAKLALKNTPSSTTVDSREIYTQISGKVAPGVNMSLLNMKGIQDWTSAFNATPGAGRNIWSVGADAKVGDKVSFFGEYAKNNAASEYNKLYWFGLTNGAPVAHPDLGFQVSFAKKGANAQSLIYRYYEGKANALYGGGTLSNITSPVENQLHSVLGNDSAASGGAFWLAGTKGFEFYDTRVLEKNVQLITKIGTAKSIETGKKVTDYALFQLYTFF